MARALLLVLLLASCAQLSEKEKDELRYRREAKQAEINDAMDACRRAGYVVFKKARKVTHNSEWACLDDREVRRILNQMR